MNGLVIKQGVKIISDEKNSSEIFFLRENFISLRLSKIFL